jgi:hypothetical protein
MADDALIGLDEAFARARQRPGKRRKPPVIRPPAEAAAPESTDESVLPLSKFWVLTDRRAWFQLFLGVQFLWGVLLFVPGTQALRTYIRALPYVSSLALLALYLPRVKDSFRPKGSGLMTCALLLMPLNLLHPTSQVMAGVAQCVFQLSIAAPLFWAYKTVRSRHQLEQLLFLVFIMNFASAGLGVLQVYFPDRFMPPQFNSLGVQLNEFYVESLTYIGRDGQHIVRPPGLTDQPGGAALAGGITALLGLGLSLRANKTLARLFFIGAAAVGLAVIYLTQVRSALLMVIACMGILGVNAFRQRQFASAVWIAGAGGGLLVAAFLWATSIGGDSVERRFLDIREQGALQTYQDNRGGYVSDINELLDEYPLGAGVGRWGMMNTYFGDNSDPQSPPFHVELQLTGWLLDGGVPMWVFYGGAVLMSLLVAFGLARARQADIAGLATVITPLLVFVAGLGMAGPIFNTQLGILFWVLIAALQGTNAAAPPAGPDATSEA